MKCRALLFLLGLAFAGSALAQYPSRPIRLHAPSGVGPANVARLLAAQLQKGMGQPVVVDVNSGANGNAAGEAVARSAPDGYTLLVATDAQVTINPHLYGKLRFDWNNDLLPVASLATEAFVLAVGAAVPARSVAEFIAYAKAPPHPLLYGSPGIGSAYHLAAELFGQRAGVTVTHVPFPGGEAAVVQALVSGAAQAAIGGAALDAELRSGRVRALGVAGPRSPRYPGVPAIAETLPGFEVVPWYGLFTPNGTPFEPEFRLREEVARWLALPEARERLGALGADPWAVPRDRFAAVVQHDFERYGKLVKDLGLPRLD